MSFILINMKKIIFVGQSLKIGGVEKALVEQINNLTLEYDVSLFLFNPNGPYFKDLSTKVHLIKSNYCLRCVAMTNGEARQSLITFIVRTILFVFSRIFGNKIVYKILFSFIKKIKDYDIAISYVHDLASKGLYYGCNLFVLNKIQSYKKIAWIHSDYGKLNTKDNKILYKHFDQVVNVSYAMKNKFDSYNIVDISKSKVVYNRIDCQSILNRSKENAKFLLSKDCPILMTIGRIEYMKGVLELLQIANLLKNKGYKFLWYFIGSGNQETEAIHYVNKNKLYKYIKFIGQVDNPYPYLSQCDYYISGSKSETFGLSILEALVLKKPVIAYRYDAVGELINDRENGFIANSFIELANIIELILTKPENNFLKNRGPVIDYNALNDIQIIDLFNS